jgi:hypothetical protein
VALVVPNSTVPSISRLFSQELVPLIPFKDDFLLTENRQQQGNISVVWGVYAAKVGFFGLFVICLNNSRYYSVNKITDHLCCNASSLITALYCSTTCYEIIN